MTSNWATIRLDECASFQEGYVNPTQKKEHYFDGPVKWLRAVDLNNGSIRDTSRTLSEEGFKSAGKSALLFEPGTLAISKSGTIGRIGILEDYMCGNRAVINIKVNQDVCDNLYIFYVLLTSRKVIETLAVGSVQKNLYTSALGSLELKLPPLPIQQAIAIQLSTLDKKIDLNAQTNQTLEEMAQAIFKSWFVDFDPVKAKMNGELPEGMDAATASLFPEKLVESELGLIPDGWEVKPFSEWVKITKGKNITKKTIVDGDVPVVAGGLKPAYFHNAHNVDGPAITISASGANAGYVNLYFENIWASDCSYISQSATPLFFLQYVALRYNQKKIFDMQTGAAQPHIYPRDFERLMIVVPNEELCRKLEEVFASFFRTVANNKQQNIDLAALRDTLLPKLLSGEIELGTSEELVEAI